MNASTGYYGVPGSHRERDVTKVHFVLQSRPICGARIRSNMQYQWCADGFEDRYVECRHCKRNLAVVLAKKS